MSKLYNAIRELCRQNGISIAKLCADIGISRSTLTELKAGRAQTLSYPNMKKMSEYFRVDISYFEAPNKARGEPTMNEDKILAAIAELDESISERFAGIERRLEAVEEKHYATVKLAEELSAHQRKQREDISELFRRIDELSEDGRAIWRSRDGRESAFRSDDVYGIIRECGYSRGEALRIIDAAGRLSKDKRHYTKPIRIGKRVPRAIVIFEKE